MKNCLEKYYDKIYFYLRNSFYVIKYYFKPQHEEIRQVIPNTWIDLDYIIEEVLFASLISFVEKEKGFECIEWEEDEKRLAIKEKLEDAYHYAKTERFFLKEKLNKNFSFDTELQLKEIETAYLKTIVELRNYLWT